MENLWIISAIAAAFFQAIRLAAQKDLNRHLSTLATAYARVLFGLPVLTLHLLVLLAMNGAGVIAMSPRFLLMCLGAAFGQVLGSALLVRMFQIGNFAVATMLVKVDVIITAVAGTLLFSQGIPPAGWLAILVTVVGMLLTSAGRLPAGVLRPAERSLTELLLGPATRFALMAAAMYAFSYLFLREAIVELEPIVASPALRAAWAGVIMTVLSVATFGVWLIAREREQLARMRGVFGLCCFVGVMSALGTIFWFFASAFAKAAYVAAVAQVQIAFTLALSHFYFRERIRPLELVGIAVILAGVLLFRVAA